MVKTEVEIINKLGLHASERCTVRFFKQADWKQQINWLIFLCLGICFFLSIINQTRVINFYYAAIILAIIAQLISLDHFSYTNLWVPGVMVCWAVIRWAWLLWQGYPHHVDILLGSVDDQIGNVTV